MLCSITLELGNPSGDNAALLEALDIVGAQSLPNLRRGRHYLALTPTYFREGRDVYRFLIKFAKDGDRIDVAELRLPRGHTDTDASGHSLAS